MKTSLLPFRPFATLALLALLPTITQATESTLVVRVADRSAVRIPRFITGKFAEHLGNNIYNGMDAQILRNPTFAAYPFATGQQSPDGIATFHYERDRISQAIRQQAGRTGWPPGEGDALVESYFDGLAAFWGRVGPRNAVQVSPAVEPQGGRAQRIQAKAAGQGVAQWTWLPLHRVREYEFEVLLRSPEVATFTVAVSAGAAEPPLTKVSLTGVSTDWHVIKGKLALPADAPADAAYRFALTADSPGQFVIGRVRLWPADHIDGFDPDIIRFLKASKLPLLRWPGGNFVSGYHWEDGVGPVERRPTKPNYAWGGVEPNLFGTDEFIAFCRAVGCEPMICVNAGDGTPEEAARWIDYCNGPADSPMGRLRAANGHPEPFHVRHWEVGNELWGRWQFHWTTATGNVDRYQRFAKAMLTVDPTIQLYACGAPIFWGKNWNDTLIADLGPALRSITDHPLIGGNVTLTTDPLDVFRDFMAVPGVLEEKWASLRDDLARGGVREPRLAVTELQLFAHLGSRGDISQPARLTRENLPSQGSITEALYDILIYHAAVRLQPFVGLITHSAIVNHGGGLRKERERVYANPCYYAQTAFADFAEATPVAVELTAPTEHAPLVLPELRNVVRERDFKTVDALAALAPNGDLLFSLVNCSTGPLKLAVELKDFAARGPAQVQTLAADKPWSGNTLEQPDAVKPVDSVDSAAEVRDGRLTLDLPAFSVSRVRLVAK